MKVPVSFRTLHAMADKNILVDSRATDNFIHPKLLKRLGLGAQALDRPRKIWNIDGTTNRAGQLTSFVDLEVRTGSKEEKMRFLVTDLGNEDLILGYPWLAMFEPQFNWQNSVVDTAHLPIIVRSLDWRKGRFRPIVARMVAGRRIASAPPQLSHTAKLAILQELEQECTHARGISTDLAAEAGQHTKPVAIPAEYQQHAQVFSEEELHRFPPACSWDHAINFKPGSPDSLNCKVYATTPRERTNLCGWLDDMLARRYIEHTNPDEAYIASPFFYLKKKDGSDRPVQDYRKANALMQRDFYPVPLIPPTIARVRNTSIFTKFDVCQGYNNIRIRREDRHKAAFKTEFGIFVPNVMFFGLTNSPATFQRMMDSIFQRTIDKHHLLGTEILVYMDDILIASSSGIAGHRATVHDILAVLEEHDLYLKPEKCVWEADSVDYLGLILEKGVTHMDPTKVEGVRNWATPSTKKHVRSFLGFCNFYRAFIRGFAKLAKPLNNLTKKDAPWIWGNDEQNAFNTLKHRITEEPILRQPQMDKQFELEVDASGYAIGAVLMQRQEDGKRHPVGFYSATLNDAERNYDIYDLELLAVVKSLENWRTYLAGSPHKVIVFTDHMNLQYWRDPHKISRRVARQVLRLAEYDIELRHIPGKTNGRTDALSRLPNYNQGGDDNEDVTVLPDHLFVRLSLTEDEEQQDEKMLRPWVDPHNLREVDGVWWKEGRRVVTGDLAYRQQVVHDHHDLPAYGHPGISRTTALTERHYWWPRMRQEIRDYVGGCADCQRNKVNTQARKAPLTPIFPQPEALPFETVAMDFIVKLPLSNGFDSILTITDHDCTKAALFIPCNETITAEGVAELYLQHVFKRFGLPQKIISDRDPRLAGKFAKALCAALGITQNMSTAFHPRTDGQSERTNQGLEQYLRFYVNTKQSNWAQLLSIAEFAHNSWRNESTGQSPFDLLMGYHPRAEWTTVQSPIPQVTLRLDQIREARGQAQAAMIKAQQGWERRKRTAPTFQTGDQVWLDGRNIKTFHPTAKLAPKRHGPFPIIRVLSPITYELRLPVQWKLHPVFHVDLLTPYRETEFHGANYDKPPPDLIDGEEEYEVERIVASRRFGRGHKLQYLVKWKGYPDAENQWVAKEDVFAEEAIKEFHDLNSDSSVHIRRARTDSNDHPPSSECPLPGPLHEPFERTSLTSTPVSSAGSLNSAYFATSPTSTDGNTTASAASTAVSTTTTTTRLRSMITPEPPYAPTEPPFRRYADTHDSIGCADLTTPEEEIRSRNTLARTLGTAPATATNIANWNSVVAVTTDGTPITRDELDAVMRRFPTPAAGALGSPEPEDPGYHLLSQTTGEPCNDAPLTKAEVNRLLDALPQCAAGPSPGPLPTRPRHGTAEVVAGGRPVMEEATARARPGSTGNAQEEGGRVAAVTGDPSEEDLFPAEHPFIRLEPAARPDDTPHLCATDGTPLYKGNVSNALLHAYAHPAAPRRRARPDQPLPGFVHNRGDQYVPFVTTHNNVRRQVDFVQTIFTANPLVIGIRTDTDLVFAKPLHATPEYVFGTRPIYIMEDLEVLDEGHVRRAMIDREIAELHDVTVHAEVVRYRSLAADLVYLEGRLMELERQWGEMSSKKLGCIRRLEMANVLARLETQRGNILDVEG
jgi:hypothetical protein